MRGDERPGESAGPRPSPHAVATTDEAHEVGHLALLLVRSMLGGLLMGLANLVPGISGGTMLVAAGIYPRFIGGIAEITTLRFRMPSLLVLGTVAISALSAILLLAGVVKGLVVDHRWVMYSLFIGLTLGGLPVVWRMARRADRAVWTGAAGGFAVMVLLALFQSQGQSGSDDTSFAMLALGGVAGASAMILPGISGGYLLLVLGQYLPILDGIDRFKEALRARDLEAAFDPALGVVLPVGLGVVVGIVLVSNAIRWLLEHHEKATLGVLLGLLAGAVLGLWPFQENTDPVLGQTIIKGQVVTAENLADLDREDYPTAFFTPAPWQVGASLGLIGLGFLATTAVAMIGRDRSASSGAPISQ